MADQVQEVEATKNVAGKTVLSITKPTPMWATWIFRIIFIVTGVAVFIVAADPGIAAELKVRIGIYLKGLDVLVWGITRMMGVEVSRDYNVPLPKNSYD